MNRVSVCLIGAGNRGQGYAEYALRNPHELKLVAVAEPNPQRRNQIKDRFGLEERFCFANADELLAMPKLADAVLICTQDHMHVEPAIQALQAGYHVLLEKPMAVTARDCIRLSNAATEANRILSICHVLRYTAFFSMLNKLLKKGEIGALQSIQHNENVAYWHHAHSYVRGNWRNTAESSPMILSKSSHDLDIMLWLAGADCERISSFGSLSHFKAENAPHGAPKRCLDGCPAADTCAYYAPKQYLTKFTGWPTSAISDDMSYESRLNALSKGPYGRCVYHCDNDVVDHQVVSLEFAGGITAVFTMSAFTQENSRTIKLMGTQGEIRGAMDRNEIEVHLFESGVTHRISMPLGESGHGGGDFGLMHDFVRDVRIGATNGNNLTSVSNSVQSHLMAFAAEKARMERRVVEMKPFIEDLTK